MAWRYFGFAAAILASSAFATMACAEGLLGTDLRVSTEEKKYGPVALKCPKDANGTIELITGNRRGINGRLRVGYEGGVGVLAVTDTRVLPNPEFGQQTVYDLKDLESDSLNIFLKQLDAANALLNEVCNGSPEAKQRYRELLDSNLSILGLSPEDYPSDF